MKTTRKKFKILKVGVTDQHTRFLWGNVDPEELSEVSWGKNDPEICLSRDAKTHLANQESYEKGSGCDHTAWSHNGMGVARCLTCGHYTTQQGNGLWPRR